MRSSGREYKILPKAHVDEILKDSVTEIISRVIQNWTYAGVPFLLRKSVWRSSLSRDGLASKIRFWSTQFSLRNLWSRVQIRFCSTFQKFEFLVLLQFRFEVRIWNKTGNSNYWKVEQNRNWTRDHSFRREIVWSKIGFSNKIHPRVHAARNTMQKRFVDWQKSIG